MFKALVLDAVEKAIDILEQAMANEDIAIRLAEHYKQQFESLLEDVGHCAGVCDICALTDDECAEENEDSRCTFRWRGLKDPLKEETHEQ